MNLYDHVKIKKSGITGIIVDVSGTDAKSYIVESDKEREPGDTSGYPGRWPLYDCVEADLELLGRKN